MMDDRTQIEFAKRAMFVVDTGGMVRYREVLTSARELPDYARLKQALADL